ncbi:MAG TPA: hypothetical protein VM598_01960, partial [Bdellovibrionota bacterium]|nr:hypothetical protein [Bdellovibrionota bacterium]
MNRIALVATFVAAFPLSAHAFPEMVRHHYANCTTCHVSPSGGGVITQYGRELSRELLSAGGTEKESRYFYFVEPPEWLALGGDFRWVQTFRDTPTVSSGELIRMQTDLEGAVRAGPVSFVQTFGFEAERSAVGVQGGGGEFVSRRQYLMYHLDDQITFRLGKYAFNYGINVPDHIIATKRSLGWDEGSETLNLEGSYIGEAWNFYVTGSFGRPDSEFLNREK